MVALLPHVGYDRYGNDNSNEETSVSNEITLNFEGRGDETITITARPSMMNPELCAFEGSAPLIRPARHCDRLWRIPRESSIPASMGKMAGAAANPNRDA